MKKFFFTLFGLLACLQIYAQLGYRFDRKYIQLTPNTSEPYYVQTRNTGSKEYLEKIADMELHQNDGNREVYMISENSFFVSSQSNLLENDYFSEMFQDSKGNPYYILPHIILSLKDNAYINNVIKKYTGILSLDSIQRLKGMTTLTCNLSTAQEVLRVVGELDSFEEVEWCEPDMICKWEKHDSNPLFPMQYYLQNNSTGNYDINVIPAWEIITGSSDITVAVIDEGVDPDHEDLSGNVLQGYTIGDATGYGKPKNANEFNYKGHGVACAGIIGAKNNNKGILGVAYGVKILPINISPYVPTGYYYNGEMYVTYSGFTTSNTDLAYAIQWAAERADILSCSWGGDSEISVVKTAINNAMSNGRNGKGCVVVASSGNDYPYITTIKFPARIDGVIAVGAINRYGNIQSYSQRGSDLDLVAPSGLCNLQGDIVTTDRAGNLGYNPYAVLSGSDLTDMNYTQKFGGTSAACPQVAGVAALMLSANPNLTVSQIRSMLRNTARDLGSTGFDTTFGYGLVDAYAAVNAALNLSISGPSYICSSSMGTYTINNLPSSCTVNWYLSDGFGPTAPTLQISGNNCIINNNLSKSYMGILHADIYCQGTLLKTLLESVVLYADFYGTYSINGGSAQQINTSYSVIWVNHGDLVEIKSPNLVTKNVSYSVVTPYLWHYYTFSGDLDVGYPSSAGNNPIVISVQNNTNYSNCDNSHQITLMPTSVLPHYLLKTTGDNGCINVELIAERNEDALETLRNLPVSIQIDENPTWTLEVIDANLGEKVLTKEITGNSTSVSLSKSKGVFIVRATIGKEVLTEKIQVK